jgi:tetratricopeptide (TPR) repeat protein
MIVLFVCGIGAVAVPNYAGYLLQRLAEKQRDAIKFDEALASAHRAWRWDPSNYYVARLLGELYLNEARRSFNQADALAEQSVAWYRKAEELNPFDADLVSRRGDALEFLGRWADVEHARLKAVELDPNYFFYHKKLGTFYFYRGKKDLAIRSFQRVVELTPHDSYSHNKLKALGSAPLPRKPQPKKP